MKIVSQHVQLSPAILVNFGAVCVRLIMRKEKKETQEVLANMTTSAKP